MKLTNKNVDQLTPSSKSYIVWDSDVKGFGVRVNLNAKKTFILKFRVGVGRTAKIRKPVIGAVGIMKVEEARRIARKWLLVVAWFLLDHYNLKTGRCFPSHQRLAEESNYSLRQVKYATKRLCKKYFRLKRRGHTGSANEYIPVFELIDHEKAVVQYNNKIGAISEQEMVQHSAPQTIKETINKTDEKLIWKIKWGMLGRLDQAELDRGRKLLAESKKLGES